MSGPDMSAFRMSNAAAAKPPNPPPTICAFIFPLPETPGWELLPTRGCPGNRRGPEQTSASAETDADGCYRAGVDVRPSVARDCTTSDAWDRYLADGAARVDRHRPNGSGEMSASLLISLAPTLVFLFQELL